MFTYKCTLIRVVDADTLDLEIDLGFHTFIRERVRINGLNAPELRTQAGKDARNFVVGWFSLRENEPLTVHTFKDKQEKYGRYLAEIFDSSGKSLTKALLETGHAIEKVY